MSDMMYARSVRRNLATLVSYAETIEDYSARHEPDLREALNEALSLAIKLRMPSVRVFLIKVVGFFKPIHAIRQVHQFLERRSA